MKFQLTVDGVSSMTGRTVLLHVEEEARPGPELATLLYLLTVVLTVREKTLQLRTATLKSAQVIRASHFQQVIFI